jgi:predicted PurR-regulated permease PerM
VTDRTPIAARRPPTADLDDLSVEVNPRSGRRSRAAPQRAARLVFAGILILLCLWVLSGFLAALGWALILTIATWPLYDRFLSLLEESQRRFMAPFLFTLIIALVFLAPLFLAAVAAGGTSIT